MVFNGNVCGCPAGLMSHDQSKGAYSDGMTNPNAKASGTCGHQTARECTSYEDTHQRELS